MHLTIAYITGRHQPRFDWFFDSLYRQLLPEDDIEIIIVDYFAQVCDEWKEEDVIGRFAYATPVWWADSKTPSRHFAPKPTVWQGPHRLTKENWWAMSNARNTAICLAKDGYIVFVDDRGVLMPGWLDGVREAMKDQYIVCGSYQKVANLVVEQGNLVYHGDIIGVDPRKHFAPTGGPCGGEWAFGCTIGLPLEWALKVNGFDEDCDSLSFEDVIFGLMLQHNGFPMRYNPRMLYVEERISPEGIGPVFKRSDYGRSPFDKSHAILHMVNGGARVRSPNYFGPGGIVELRNRIQAGEPFPVCQIPQNEWFTGVSLKYLHELKP